MKRDDKFLKKLGSRVKEIRMERGITVRKMGELCQMDYSNYSRFENGQVSLRINTLRIIADKLDIELRELF